MLLNCGDRDDKALLCRDDKVGFLHFTPDVIPIVAGPFVFLFIEVTASIILKRQAQKCRGGVKLQNLYFRTIIYLFHCIITILCSTTFTFSLYNYFATVNDIDARRGYLVELTSLKVEDCFNIFVLTFHLVDAGCTTIETE